MKTLVIVALLFSACFASSLWGTSNNLNRDAKRKVGDTQIVCQATTTSCQDAGGKCSNGCTDCRTAYFECSAVAQAASNLTLFCECATTFVNCQAAAKDASCNSAESYQECLSEFAGIGATCGCGTPYTGEVTDYTCKSNAFCDYNSGKCFALRAVGQACNSSSECGDVNASPVYTYEYDCSNSDKCEIAELALPGDSCTTNTDCEYFEFYGLGCTNGVCAKQEIGKECPNYCGSGLYCDDDQTCRAILALGAACNSTSSDPCGDLAICDSISNKCTKFGTHTQGQSCVTDEECASGLYCSESAGDKCVKFLDQVACSNDTQCTNINTDYNGCECVGGKGVCVLSSTFSDILTQCLDVAETTNNCFITNGCIGEDTRPGGCVDKNCRQQFDCYIKCVSDKSGSPIESACVVNYENTCPATTGSTTSDGVRFTAVWALFAFVAALLL